MSSIDRIANTWSVPHHAILHSTPGGDPWTLNVVDRSVGWSAAGPSQRQRPSRFDALAWLLP